MVMGGSGGWNEARCGLCDWVEVKDGYGREVVEVKKQYGGRFGGWAEYLDSWY